MDVITDILLNLDAADFGSVAARCRPVTAEIGATALVVETAHPAGGHRGFLVTLVVVSPAPDGLPPTVAVHREANRALAALGVPHLAEDRAVEGGVCALYQGRDRIHSGLTVLSVSSVSRDLAAEEYPDGRVVIVSGAPDELAEESVVGRVHAAVPAADPIGALEACLPLADRLGAVAVEVNPREPAGRYAVALLGRFLRPPGDTDTALHQVAAAVAGRLGLAGTTVELTGQVGVMEIDRPGPDGVHALYLREGVDPFNTADEDDEDDDPFGNLERPLTPDEVGELREVAEELRATRVGFIADVAADDPIQARELVRAIADRIRPAVTDAGVFIDEPEPGDEGTVRVAAAFGPTGLAPAEALARAQAELATALASGPADWSPVPTGDDDHLVARWVGAGRPASGIVRLELHAGPGLGLA